MKLSVVFLGMILSTMALADDPNPTAQCFTHVRGASSSITIDQAVELCRGATSVEPAVCFVQSRASSSSITVDQAVELCKPVLCGE